MAASTQERRARRNPVPPGGGRTLGLAERSHRDRPRFPSWSSSTSRASSRSPTRSPPSGPSSGGRLPVSQRRWPAPSRHGSPHRALSEPSPGAGRALPSRASRRSSPSTPCAPSTGDRAHGTWRSRRTSSGSRGWIRSPGSGSVPGWTSPTHERAARWKSRGSPSLSRWVSGGWSGPAPRPCRSRTTSEGSGPSIRSWKHPPVAISTS